jgi:hypothetical protein
MKKKTVFAGQSYFGSFSYLWTGREGPGVSCRTIGLLNDGLRSIAGFDDVRKSGSHFYISPMNLL